MAQETQQYIRLYVQVTVHRDKLRIKQPTNSKGLPRQAEVAQGVPGRLRLWIILTFRHYKGGIVVDNCVIYI